MTKNNSLSRAFALGLLLSAPMLVAAEGGGCAPGEDVPIGSHDGGNGAQCGPNTCATGESCCNESCGTCTKPGEACDMLACGDGGGGEICGNNVCGEGEYCCNASCGTCTKIGEACTAQACADPCDAQDATGQGPCLLLLGYAWNGDDCELVGGCSCVGADCGTLYETTEACLAAHSACGEGTGQPCGPVTCAPGLSCCNESCGTCVAPGEACDQLLCAPECAAQDAKGEGPCLAFFGYAWDGQSCQGIGGCSCAGSDCNELYASPDDCSAAHSKCP